MAVKEIELENNKIGSAIQYFRETYHISQGKLCKGLCSIATLSRIEAGERDVDSLLLDALLERLGKTPNQFELILTDFDYVLYQSREDIMKQITGNNFSEAYRLLDRYDDIVASKGTVHMQFIVASKALLNELQGGSVDITIDLFMKAISYTVPNFKTNKISEYYLSNTELNIIIDMMQRMVSAGRMKGTKEILLQIMDYLEAHSSMEEYTRLYPKAAIIAGRLYMQELDFSRVLNLCNSGLDKNRGNRKLDYWGELSLLQAQATEAMYKTKNGWGQKQKECLKLYLQAFYLFDFCGEHLQAEKIKEHIQEEYKWADIG